MKLKSIITFMLLLSVCSSSVYATNDQSKQFSRGLQIKADRGGSLPPGWQRELVKGEVLEEIIYDHNEVVIPLDSKGLLSVHGEGKLDQLVEATREIIEALDLLNKL
jgi:hypothetical protein